MSTVRLNGIEVYYEEHGQGYPVVFTHGYSASTRMWAPQVEPLSQRYRFVTWDIRGHGQTESPEDQGQYSEALAVEDERQLLQLLGIEKAVIGGLSLGGYLALAFYRAHPELAQALILCDTGPGYRNPAAREEWNRTAERRARAFEEQGLGALSRSAEVQAASSSHRSAAGLARAARGILAQFDSRVIDSLPQISVPTLIVVGERDTPFLNGTDYMAAKIPRAEKVVIPDAGHSSNIDQPEAFNRAVLDFLARVTA